MLTTLLCLLFLVVVFAVIYGPVWFYQYRNRKLRTTVPKSDSVTLTNTTPEKAGYAKGGVLTPETVDQIQKRYRYGQPNETALRNPEVAAPHQLTDQLMGSREKERERRRQDEDTAMNQVLATTLLADTVSSDDTGSTIYSSGSSNDDSSASYGSDSGSSYSSDSGSSDSGSTDFGGGDFGGGGGGSDY